MLAYANHNMLFAHFNKIKITDINSNPYTISPPSPSPSPETYEAPKWDWNKVFSPMKQPFQPSPKAKKELEIDENFKYSSPFAKDCEIYSDPENISDPSLNPNAASFGPSLAIENLHLNPNAPSFQVINGPKPNPFSPTFKFDLPKLNKLKNLNPDAPAFEINKNLNPNAIEFKAPLQAIVEEIYEEEDFEYATNKPKLPDFNNEDVILAMHGFKKTKKMKHSLQGIIYYGETIPGHQINKQLKIPLDKKCRVVIKKTLKTLHNKSISIDDTGMSLMVDENIVKEAIILHHLTVDNNPVGNAICKLISFFESFDAYYVVTEYCGNMTLKKFIDKAHSYIKTGQLKITQWKKIYKYITWQIVAALSWLHNDMKCVHLDLTMDNIVVKNGNFTLNKEDGSITIDRAVSCKIIDFGLAEIMNDSTNANKQSEYFKYSPDSAILGLFHINNKYSQSLVNHQCPEIFEELVYDGRRADIWSLGCLLFYMCFGVMPYEKQSSEDIGFWCFKNNQIDLLLNMKHLSHLNNNKLMEIIKGCLNINEIERSDINTIIAHSFYKTYMARYAQKMKKQSEKQIKKNNKRKGNTQKNILYYCASKPTYI